MDLIEHYAMRVEAFFRITLSTEATVNGAGTRDLNSILKRLRMLRELRTSLNHAFSRAKNNARLFLLSRYRIYFSTSGPEEKPEKSNAGATNCALSILPRHPD